MFLRNVKWVSSVVVFVGVFITSSCTGPAVSGEYADPQKVRVIDDKWSPSDTQATMRTMLTSALGRPWLKNFRKGHAGRKPVVIVQDVQNRTDEHIDTVALTEFMETELINSGEVTFLEKARREQLLDELEFQDSGIVAESSKKKKGNMAGADFLLVGSISSSIHTSGQLKNTFYQIQMKLVNIETSEIAWTERKEISKDIKRKGADW